ncbi:hypothetical protein ACFLY9_01075 [Patescibacteria group bacterium]
MTKMTLTKRQVNILKSIISEFINTAHPVGSVTLYEKYDLGISPATLRAEMAKLVKEGFLHKAHSSSGRIPTTLGLRFFLDEILKEEKLDKVNETQLKEKLFQSRFHKDKFIKESVKALSQLSNHAAISLVDDVIFAYGLGQLIAQPEFEDIALLQNALNIIESESLLNSIFEKFNNDHTLKTLIGDEIGVNTLSECSIVFSPFNFFRGSKGYIAVVGPRRMRYSRVIPAVRTVSEFIEDSIRGWE